MGKAKREQKKKSKIDKAERARLEAEAARRERTRRLILIAIPVATAGGACGVWFGLENPTMTGVAILAGVLLWFLFGLGFLGGSVQPRDRNAAGSIDFGSRRR